MSYDDWKTTSPYESNDAVIAAFYEVEESEVTWAMRDNYQSDAAEMRAER